MYKVHLYLLNFNYGHFLGEVLASLDREITEQCIVSIVDNGSHDGSRDRLKAYADERKYNFYEFNNLPISVIGNRMAKAAEAQYLVRIDADDFLNPGYIKDFLMVAERDQPDIIYSNYDIVDVDGLVTHTSDMVVRKAENGSMYFEPFHGAFTWFSIEFLQRVGGYNEKYKKQDGFDLYLKSRDYTHYLIHIPQFSYRRGHASLSSQKSALFETRLEMINDFYDNQCHNFIRSNIHILACPKISQKQEYEFLTEYTKRITQSGQDYLVVSEQDYTEFNSVKWSETHSLPSLRTHSMLKSYSDVTVHSLASELAPLKYFTTGYKAAALFGWHKTFSMYKPLQSVVGFRDGQLAELSRNKEFVEATSIYWHIGGMTHTQQNSNHKNPEMLGGLEITPNQLRNSM